MQKDLCSLCNMIYDLHGNENKKKDKKHQLVSSEIYCELTNHSYNIILSNSKYIIYHWCLTYMICIIHIHRP